MMIKKSFTILALIGSMAFINCSRTGENIPQDIKVKDFVWGGLNAYYKWQSDVPDLADDKFSNREQLDNFLAGYDTPQNLFKSLLYQYGTVDKFSWFVEDYEVLENSFQGKRTTSGMKISVKEYGDGSTNAYAYVTDVISGSDAEQKGVKRGDIFNKVDGVQLTTDNVKSVFNNNEFSITLIGGFKAGFPIDGTTTYNLIKTEIEENPVRIAKTLNYSGKKIGYLMYNQFASDYDAELNDAFRNFKTDGIEELIVDLRYNGGGSVRTATYLASMITGQFTGELFATEEWNEKVMKNVNTNFELKFTNEIKKDNLEEAINSVSMTRVFFIVSNQTASASELVINGLIPYLGESNVILIGDTTVGKQVASITLYDADDYKKNGENFNTAHRYAMQPIVLELKNAEGENKPEGFTPTIKALESTNLGNLGDVTEPLLARTLAYMTTGRRPSARQEILTTKSFWNNSMNNSDYQRMYVDLK